MGTKLIDGPPPDLTAAPGVDDLPRDMIAADDKLARTIPKGDPNPKVREAADALREASEASCRGLLRIADEHAAKMRASAGLVRAGAEAAAAAVPTFGHGSPQDLEGKRAAARADAEQKIAAAVASELADKHTDAAAQTGAFWGAAFFDLGDAVQDGWLDYQLPPAISRASGLGADDVRLIENLADELLTEPSPTTAISRALDYVAGGDDERRTTIFLSAARKVAREVLKLAPPQLVARFPDAPKGEFEDERSRATAIAKRVDELRAARRPTSIVVGLQLISNARQFALAVFGSAPAKTWPCEYEARGLDAAAHSTERPAPWQLMGAVDGTSDNLQRQAEANAKAAARAWIASNLPPAGTPAGWSEHVVTSRLGVKIRLPGRA